MNLFPFSTRHLFIGFLVFATLLTDAFLAYSAIARLVKNERLIARSFQTLAEIEAVESLSKDLENGARAFVLTGDERALKPFRIARDQIPNAIAALQLEASDAEQERRAVLLSDTLQKRAAIAAQGVKIRREKGFSSARQFVASGAGQRENGEITRIALLMRIRENELLEQRSLESRESADDANRTFWIASAANLAFLGLICVLLWRAGAQNARLGIAYDDLKRAEEMRDGLSAMLVHDLRTPLTSLLGPLEMLRAQTLGPLDKNQEEVVALAFQSGQRLLILVNELLDVSKLEAGELQIKPQPTLLRPLLDNAISNVRGLEWGGGVKMEIECVEIETLSLDGPLFERILINLLGNAQKFTPSDGTIRLGVEKGGQGAQNARIWVQDSGQGIPAEFHEKIFEKFGQVETRQAGKKFSTGLGLTFCKLAVEAHGGKIGVQSEIGRGSRFWIEL